MPNEVRPTLSLSAPDAEDSLERSGFNWKRESIYIIPLFKVSLSVRLPELNHVLVLLPPFYVIILFTLPVPSWGSLVRSSLLWSRSSLVSTLKWSPLSSLPRALSLCADLLENDYQNGWHHFFPGEKGPFQDLGHPWVPQTTGCDNGLWSSGMIRIEALTPRTGFHSEGCSNKLRLHWSMEHVLWNHTSMQWP